MKVHVTFAIETGAVGGSLVGIETEAVKIGTRYWLRLREQMGDSATLVSIVAVPGEADESGKPATCEPVKPPAHPLFPDPRTVCKPCDGTGRDTRVPANGWDVACSACNGTGRTPAAGTAPKGAK